jgi:PST family polysaccharide transporter
MRWLIGLWQGELGRITSLNSLSVGLKLVTGFVTSKLLAIYIGPTGLALVGNLRNFLTSIENIATLGFANGIVKYTAAYKNDPNQLKNFLSTVLTLLPVMALITSCCIAIFADYWSFILFGSSSPYTSVFYWFALALPWYLIQIVLMSILNGLEAFKKVVYTQILSSLIGLVITVILVIKSQTFGALVAVVVAPSLTFFCLSYYLKSQLLAFRPQCNRVFIEQLFHYTLMAIASSVIGPLVLIALRNQLILNIGSVAAGFWEALTRISSFYFLFLSTLIGLYFLPRLSKVANDFEEKAILKNYYTQVFPLFTIGLIVFYLLRHLVVSLFYTHAFEPITDLIQWQVLGDFFKGAALILGYRFFAYRKTGLFIFTELFSLTSLYFLSRYGIQESGLEGFMQAYVVNYALYFLFLLFIYLFRKPVHG